MIIILPSREVVKRENLGYYLGNMAGFGIKADGVGFRVVGVVGAAWIAKGARGSKQGELGLQGSIGFVLARTVVWTAKGAKRRERREKRLL
jgi:hypothetical protein